MTHINIEIKARCSDQEALRAILKSKNANFRGVDNQIDTYFNVNSGRLKLREGNIENCLIWYERENKKGPKQSNIVLYKSTPHSFLKEILTKASGILAIVDKQREIYFISNVKFHLDSVKDLGTFVEIEAIDADGTLGLPKIREQCDHYLHLFGIREEDLLNCSYSDMILQGK